MRRQFAHEGMREHGDDDEDAHAHAHGYDDEDVQVHERQPPGPALGR